VIGHRGAAGLAPENTCAALELALAEGAEALEFDVQLSADGIPVLMHDPSLDRTTLASGLLRERTASELGALDAGYHFTLDQGGSYPWRGRGLGVPSLAEVLRRFPEVPLLIELKTVGVAEPVRRVLQEHGARERVVLASFLEAALAPFRAAGFHTGASRKGILALWLRSKLGWGAPGGSDQIYAVPDYYRDRVHVPTPAFIRSARRAGRPVHVWTVNDPARAAWLWRRGVSGIITNFPAVILAERSRVFS
jgi:glycerophosphoryl diester phosphodiesterase